MNKLAQRITPIRSNTKFDTCAVIQNSVANPLRNKMKRKKNPNKQSAKRKRKYLKVKERNKNEIMNERINE